MGLGRRAGGLRRVRPPLRGRGESLHLAVRPPPGRSPSHDPAVSVCPRQDGSGAQRCQMAADTHCQMATAQPVRTLAAAWPCCLRRASVVHARPTPHAQVPSPRGPGQAALVREVVAQVLRSGDRAGCACACAYACVGIPRLQAAALPRCTLTPDWLARIVPGRQKSSIFAEKWDRPPCPPRRLARGVPPRHLASCYSLHCRPPAPHSCYETQCFGRIGGCASPARLTRTLLACTPLSPAPPSRSRSTGRRTNVRPVNCPSHALTPTLETVQCRIHQSRVRLRPRAPHCRNRRYIARRLGSGSGSGLAGRVPVLAGVLRLPEELCAWLQRRRQRDRALRRGALHLLRGALRLPLLLGRAHPRKRLAWVNLSWWGRRGRGGLSVGPPSARRVMPARGASPAGLWSH